MRRCSVDKYYAKENPYGCSLWEYMIFRDETTLLDDTLFLECMRDDVDFILDCLNGRHCHGANGL